ncbi:MAG: hypothetical protein JNK88_07295 [Mangrovicoccus sp.]|nr:hypothetical protein [Mangrovicoccus sp.]
MIFRTQMFAPDDIDTVKEVQVQQAAKPLSAFLGQPAPAAAPEINFPVITKKLAKEDFFEFLDFALQFAPSQPNEVAIRVQLASIGACPGKTFNFRDLPVEQKAEVVAGLLEGKRKVDEAATRIGTMINGWSVGPAFGDTGFSHGDWLPASAGSISMVRRLYWPPAGRL